MVVIAIAAMAVIAVTTIIILFINFSPPWVVYFTVQVRLKREMFCPAVLRIFTNP